MSIQNQEICEKAVASMISGFTGVCTKSAAPHFEQKAPLAAHS
jgi:hypothetical protein